ncbi:MAG: hypothetical protein KKB31_03800 [Nanoarchaeota archaeon]|nr:hypothetical protein [Nanoarchaeota archaeon]
MNFQFYVEKLKGSSEYEEFMKNNKGAIPVSGFLVMDKQGAEPLVTSSKLGQSKEKSDNQQHFDFFVPEEKKMFSLKLEKGCELSSIDIFGESPPKEIDLDMDFDFNEVEDLILSRMEKEGVKNKIQKLLFSLQKKDGKHYLIGTIFISSLGLLKVSVDVEDMKIEDFEKKSFFDIVKIKKK